MKLLAIGNQMDAWLKAHKASAHALAAVALTIAGGYITQPSVRLLIDSFLAQHQKLAAVFAAAITIYLRYSQSKKTAASGQ